MAERSAIQIFRIIAPEFKDVPDTEVEAMLELCEPLVSPSGASAGSTIRPSRFWRPTA